MREEGGILKCDWMEEWTTDAIVERELRYRLFVPDEYREIQNILAWLYSISDHRISPATPPWSWEYGQPLTGFIGIGQFNETREEGWILKCDWIEEWTNHAMERVGFGTGFCSQMGTPVLKR
ncbi:hypothetical protein CEXT_7641 [Caerostris extrusa]|uniref:Uncharacterized protein n=1 Tax=Caerostris extrusa TaxID=172846 RepID=A0AAV4XQD8_CAEEX|nr:hypothetical protein CEXT_7641 [Caerostris extrusa]